MKVIKVKTTHTLKGYVVLWLLEILQSEYFVENIVLKFHSNPFSDLKTQPNLLREEADILLIFAHLILMLSSQTFNMFHLNSVTCI